MKNKHFHIMLLVFLVFGTIEKCKIIMKKQNHTQQGQ